MYEGHPENKFLTACKRNNTELLEIIYCKRCNNVLDISQHKNHRNSKPFESFNRFLKPNVMEVCYMVVESASHCHQPTYHQT